MGKGKKIRRGVGIEHGIMCAHGEYSLNFFWRDFFYIVFAVLCSPPTPPRITNPRTSVPLLIDKIFLQTRILFIDPLFSRVFFLKVSLSDVNHEIDCRTAWLGVHPSRSLYQRYTVMRGLYFKSTPFFFLRVEKQHHFFLSVSPTSVPFCLE